MDTEELLDSADRRRADAAAFYRHLVDQDLEALTTVLAPDVLVHSPVVGRGLDVALDATTRCFARGAEAPPQPDPCFAVVDGTTVTTCYAMPQSRPDGSSVDFFWMDTVRIENGLVVEWWPSINEAAPTQVSWIPPGHHTGAHGAGASDPDGLKRLAVGFYREVFDSQDAGAVPRFVTEDYLQHSRHLPSGRAGLQELATSLFPEGPRATPDPMTLEPTLLVAEGDLVVHAVTLSQRAGARADGAPCPSTYPYIVYDAYRVREGKIAEHWSGVNPVAPPLHGEPRPDEEGAGAS